MKKNNKTKHHPEVMDIKNICEVSSKTKVTKDVCEKVNKESIMKNKEVFEGDWKEIKGRLKKFFSDLTNDDLQQIEANQQEIFGKLQERYGYSEKDARKAVASFKNIS